MVDHGRDTFCSCPNISDVSTCYVRFESQCFSTHWCHIRQPQGRPWEKDIGPTTHNPLLLSIDGVFRTGLSSAIRVLRRFSDGLGGLSTRRRVFGWILSCILFHVFDAVFHLTRYKIFSLFYGTFLGNFFPRSSCFLSSPSVFKLIVKFIWVYVHYTWK